MQLNEQTPAPTWLGLQVHRYISTGDFVARVRYGGGQASRLHEISNFVREDERWFYLDGMIQL